MKQVLVIGNGKLADSIIKELPKYSDKLITKYSKDAVIDKNTIFLHAGSGRQYCRFPH